MNLSTADILWIVIASALVFLMQPGFMCLESGLTRSKNSINVAVKNLADFTFSVLSFWVVGYGFMFGLSHSGIIGTTGFFTDYADDGALAAFFLFQVMFCGTATTIFSGAVAERMKFSSYLIIVFILSSFIYPLFGHWAWNGLDSGTTTGWLGKAGFIDFAGSTVVHSVGGWIALAVLMVIGPRKGRFDSTHAAFGFNGSNLPLSVLGTFLLWFGWIGFNGGSTLVMNGAVPQILVYTTLAGAAGACANLFFGYLIYRLPRVTFLINGSLGGLVAITANCHVVNAADAVIIGLFAGVITILTEIALNHFKIDDAVGAIPVHLSCGIWGTLAVALFGDQEMIGTGLSMAEQLWIQFQGVFAAFAIAFVLPYYLIKNIDRFFPLRVSDEAEHIGLNVSEHGATTELIELFQAMDQQAQEQDHSMRMPVEPFTEVGLIAERYNQVMDSLENALSETEAVINTAKDAIITCLQDSFKIISINPSGQLLFGYSGEQQFQDLSLKDLFESDTFQQQQHKMLNGSTVEVTGKTRDGALFPMEAVITTAGPNDPTFYIGTFRDITELKNREEILRDSELRYRELFENTGTPTIIINPDNIIDMANEEFQLLTGYHRKEVEDTMLFDELLPADEQAMVAEHREEQVSGRPGAARACETRMVTRDGLVKPVFINVSVIPDSCKTIVS